MSTESSPTEQRNPATMSIDLVSSLTAVRSILSEDTVAVAAAAAVADRIAEAVELTHARLVRGGTVHYFGAGASGRIAMMDATEITPTFGLPEGAFTFHFPGGLEAITDSSIDMEDSEAAGFDDAAVLTARSVAVGVTASGSTLYVVGALRRAREVGALTILITCNPAAALTDKVDLAVITDTGPEALTGSTRLKAGTATKVVLNAFSTVLMIRSGRVYSNLMVGMVPSNRKLRDRGARILSELTAAPLTECADVLGECGGNVAIGIIRILTGQAPAVARDALRQAGGVRQAVALILSGTDA